MREHFKTSGKVLLHAVFWVYVFSIQIAGKSIYQHAHGVLVDNPVVHAIDEEAYNLYARVTRAIDIAFTSKSLEKDEVL